MTDPADSFQTQLAVLRQEFADKLPQRMAAITAAHAAWCEGGDASMLGEYHRLVHNLTGAGATFGYDRISQRARPLERYLKQLSDVGDAPDAAQFLEAAALLDEVRAELLRTC
jgi:HPt (histidine-containing phosphotransfer) domain-containing protein